MRNQKEQTLQEAYEEFLNRLEEVYGIVRGDRIKPGEYTFERIAGELGYSPAYFNKVVHGHEAITVAAYKHAILLLRCRSLEREVSELKKQQSSDGGVKKAAGQGNLAVISVIVFASLLMAAIWWNQSSKNEALKTKLENAEQPWIDSISVVYAEKDSIQRVLLSYLSETNSLFIVRDDKKLRDIMSWHGKININWLIYQGILINLDAKKAYMDGVKLDTARLMKRSWDAIKTHIGDTRHELGRLGFFTPTGKNIVELLADALPEEDLWAGLEFAKEDLLNPKLEITDLRGNLEIKLLAMQGQAWEKMAKAMNEDISRLKSAPSSTGQKEITIPHLKK